jgi:ribosomal protein S18 acetylase RimI-like enzyme
MYLEDANDISSIKPASEITALYVLKQYQKKGIGHALMQEAYKRVTKNKIVLFVLESNEQAIRFYKNLGFVFTGHKIIQPVPGGELVEVEMVLER